MLITLRRYTLYVFFAVTGVLSVAPITTMFLSVFFGVQTNILPFSGYEPGTDFASWFLPEGLMLSTSLIVITGLVVAYVFFASLEMCKFDFNKPQFHLLVTWCIHVYLSLVLGIWAIQTLSILLVLLACISIMSFVLVFIILPRLSTGLSNRGSKALLGMCSRLKS
jgi:hypothetical protein